MGFFSWKTSDTEESIPSSYSARPTFPVHMITDDGRKFTEPKYEGYGEFGGKDIFELIAEMNGCDGRSEAIDLVHKDNPTGSFALAAERGVRLPKLIRNLRTADVDWNQIPYPENCEYQGYFYHDTDEDEE